LGTYVLVTLLDDDEEEHNQAVDLYAHVLGSRCLPGRTEAPKTTTLLLNGQIFTPF
jgi:hypothetical protein